MGIFDFLKKKKDEDLGDLGGDLGGNFGPEPAFPNAQAGAGTPQLFSDQQMPPPPGMQPSSMSMNLAQPNQGIVQSGSMDLLASRIEVISSKIDALRTSLERLNEKLDYIERFLAASGGRRYG